MICAQAVWNHVLSVIVIYSKELDNQEIEKGCSYYNMEFYREHTIIKRNINGIDKFSLSKF